MYSYLDRLLSRVICGNLVITNDNSSPKCSPNLSVCTYDRVYPTNSEHVATFKKYIELHLEPRKLFFKMKHLYKTFFDLFSELGISLTEIIYLFFLFIQSRFPCTSHTDYILTKGVPILGQLSRNRFF